MPRLEGEIYGYVINEGQKNSIEKQSFGSGQYFNPVQDKYGRWFIFETEMDAAVKNKGWAKSEPVLYEAPESII